MTRGSSASLGLIGNTPLVRLDGFDTGLCEVFLKLENQNPGGSIKDRMAVAMIEAAERTGQIRPGCTLVEATAGNTGIGLALVAAAKGYQLILVIPDKMSAEKIAHARALGAEIEITRSDVSAGHPAFYIDRAIRIAREKKDTFHINQFSNPANPVAHETTTAPEIWQQMQHDVDAIVCGVGSGGTITGISRYFERVQPDLEVVLADPAGSSLASYVTTGEYGPGGSYVVEGIGQSKVPPIADLSRVKKAYTIDDQESLTTVRDLLRRTGILAGTSTGTLLAAALRYGREQTTPKRIVTFVCDTGAKYLSKVFNDYWMFDQGYVQRPSTGTLRDLITRQYDEGAVITVGPDDTLLTAFRRMQMADVSQVPVVENGRCVGLLDESDLLLGVHDDTRRFQESVRNVMSTRLETVQTSATVSDVYRILDRGLVALVVDGEHFVGLITRTDLLNYLRRRMK